MSAFVSGSLARVRQVTAVLRLRPFDCSTEVGRSQERYRRAALTTVTSFFGKCVGILATLLTVRLTLSYLGAERYGMWMTISSVVTMVSFTDLGIGAALIGAVSESAANGDHAKARQYISSALLMMLGTSSALLLVFAAVYPFVSWGRVFNVHTAEAAPEAGPAAAVFLVFQLATMILSLVAGIRMGYQEGFTNAIWAAAGNVLTLAGVLIAVHLKASLPWLIVSVLIAPVLTAMLNGWLLVYRDHPAVRPNLSAVTGASLRRLCRLGLLFFILQFSCAIAYSSDNIVAAQVLGADAVTNYSVPFKLFSLPMVAVMMLVAPLWPAYTEAIARGDAAWVRRTLIRSLTITVAFSAGTSFVLVVFGNAILRLWVGPTVSAPFSLLLGFGIWNVMSAAGNTLSMLFNGAHVFKFQAWSALTMALSNLGLSIFLAYRVGLSGIIWGTVVSYSICCVLPWAVFVPKLLARIGVKEIPGQTDQLPSATGCTRI